MKVGELLGPIALVFLLGACSEEAPPARCAPPCDARAGIERARFFEIVRRAERAEKEDAAATEALWREALQIRPDHETATLALAVLRQRAGDVAEATALLERLRVAQPLLHRPSLLLGDLAASEGPGARPDLRRAAAFYEEAAKKDPTDTGPWLRLARVQALLGDGDAARRSWEVVLGSHPTSLAALHGLAEDALHREDPEAATDFFLRALRAGLQVTGRRDVPSEMDTSASFIATGAATENSDALSGLARAARALGGYPKRVPPEFRLP